VWPLDPIADAAFDALRQRDDELREEHAVYGLDARAELDIHPIIAAGLAHAGSGGFGVLREQPYPHEWFRKLRPGKSGLNLPIPRDRMRCDLVLTPNPGQTLDDALHNERQRRGEAAELEGTLFESLATAHLTPGTPHPPTSTPAHLHTIPPESAFWLEIKLVGQFTNTSGVPGPNLAYAGEITRNPIADLRKLADDDRIRDAGVLLIVFTADEATARHDLTILAHRLLDMNIPIPLGGPLTRSFPIPDRIGNTLCTVCLLGLRKD
jgi:hypothetical protein